MLTLCPRKWALFSNWKMLLILSDTGCKSYSIYRRYWWTAAVVTVYTFFYITVSMLQWVFSSSLLLKKGRALTFSCTKGEGTLRTQGHNKIVMWWNVVVTSSIRSSQNNWFLPWHHWKIAHFLWKNMHSLTY